ncbi:hypothetical protein [Paenibacillus etheri]|nr:hypothetical protein [Paenibacillus etheri]
MHNATLLGVARPKQGTSTKYGTNLCQSMEYLKTVWGVGYKLENRRFF